MSFFTKALSKVGIGAAKIDTVLDSEQLQPGETLSGVLNITGGKVEQQVNKIDLDVYCNYFVEEEYEDEQEVKTRVVERTCRINSWDVEQSFTINPNEQKQIPFSFALSAQAPLSYGQSKTWLQTNLDIDFALDRKDKDYLHIVPSTLQEATLHAISQLGFDMVEAESEGCDHHTGELPFIQEFEFKAFRGDFKGRLDELELVMMNYGDELGIHLEIDRKARGIGGMLAHMFGRDETTAFLSLTETNIDTLCDELYQLIDQNS